MKRTQLYNILSDLVAFPTETGNYTTNNEALEYIDRFLSERGMYVFRHSYNDIESLVATTRPTKTPEVMLAAHLDVVPGTESQYQLREENGKLYGRGVLDMKFAIAGYLELVDALQDDLASYDFGIMITTDEEIGGYNGVKSLLADGYRAKVAIIPDGGENWAVESFAKGITWYTITAHGKSAHASRPWEGESAIEKLIDILTEVRKLFPEQTPGGNTYCIGQIHAGAATNQIPNSAEARIDVRLANSNDQILIREAIEKICKERGATVEIPVDDPAYANDPKDPYIAEYLKQMEHVLGYPSSTTISVASNDGRFFAQYGIPCVVFYPPGGDHHGPHEYIEAEAFEQNYEMLRGYIETVARKAVAAEKIVQAVK